MRAAKNGVRLSTSMKTISFFHTGNKKSLDLWGSMKTIRIFPADNK